MKINGVVRSVTGVIAALPLLVMGCVLSAPVHAEESVWLSTLDLSQGVQGWGKPQADKSVNKRPLTLGGKIYAHGFGTHAPGALVVDLDKGAKRFQATVGVDDEVEKGTGHVEFLVLGDDHKPLWRSGVMQAGTPSKTIDLDLTGVKQIALVVSTGGERFDFSHADWADAKFLVEGSHPRTIPLPIEPDPTIATEPVSDTPRIRTPFVVGAQPGKPFLWTVPVGGKRPLSFSVTGLPKGLRIDRATGTITGTVAAVGDYAVPIQVKNSVGQDKRTVRIVVGDKLALTPPMGWNSYDCFGDDVTEAEFLANARYLSERMQPYGWDTAVVDFRWYDPGTASKPNDPPARAGVPLTIDAWGRLLPSPNKFPLAAKDGGFTEMAKRVHAMGMKFGIHIMRGIPRNAVKANLPIEGTKFTAADAADTTSTCTWCPDMYGVRGDTAAGQAYYDSLLRLYASWGIDFIKVDDMSRPYHTAEIEAVRKAIDRCGRSIVFSLSPGATPVDQAAHVVDHANMWREADDFWDDWSALNSEFALGAAWHDAVGPGHWPDGDMLPVGHLSVSHRSVGADRQTRFSKSEQLTLLSLWSLLPSPLMVGANLPDNDAWTQALLTNPEVLAINQDALGAPGTRISPAGDQEVWMKLLSDGSVAVGLFNRGFFSAPITVQWSDLGRSGDQTVRDLWQYKDIGVFPTKYTTTVPAHGAVLLRLIAKPK